MATAAVPVKARSRKVVVASSVAGSIADLLDQEAAAVSDGRRTVSSVIREAIHNYLKQKGHSLPDNEAA